MVCSLFGLGQTNFDVSAIYKYPYAGGKLTLFDTNYTHPTVYTDFGYQKSITAEYHRSLLRPVYGWFACIIAKPSAFYNRMQQ